MAYRQVFLNTFPILFGPYFAQLAKESYAVVGYGMAVLYSLVLVSLDNIQERLEIPFDEDCADDVNLDIIGAYDKVLLDKVSKEND
jgi:predicted membrane chloride channel (bestrophin family)